MVNNLALEASLMNKSSRLATDPGVTKFIIIIIIIFCAYFVLLFKSDLVNKVTSKATRVTGQGILKGEVSLYH